MVQAMFDRSWVLVGILLVATTAAAQWSTDLGREARFADDPEGIPAGVVFLSNQRLLAYVVETPEKVALRPRGEYVGPDAPRLRALVLDAATGKVVEKHDLPATGYHVLRVMPTAAGGFYVRLQKVIALYGPDFKVVAQRELPHQPGHDFWVAKVSSSGRTLWLYHDHTHTVERFDADTFQPLSACSGVVMTDFSSVSDDKMLNEARQSYVVRNAACDSATFPQVVGRKGKRAPLQCGMAHPFLGETEVAVGGCGRVTFSTLGGSVLGEDYFGWKNQVWVFPQVAREQTAAAFWSFQSKGSLGSFFGSGGPAGVKKSEIRVYDTAAYRLAEVVALDPQVKLRGFALSPDGMKLAVMQGSVVSAYRVTEPTGEKR
jgi:hypothetical protein